MKVKELLSDPAKWTKNTHARAADGSCVTERDVRAVCFCMLGAINKCYPSFEEGRLRDRVERRVLSYIELLYPFDDIASFNDCETITHSDVMRVLEKADV